MEIGKMVLSLDFMVGYFKTLIARRILTGFNLLNRTCHVRSVMVNIYQP